VRRILAIDRLARDRMEDTRESLVSLILSGDVTFDGEIVRDPRATVRADAIIAIRKQQFVSRGGLKLEFVLEAWGIAVAGKVVVDAGSSTGGFTQVLLARGAAAVHAVDVGYNQLDYRLRRDPKVFVHERTNIMAVDELDPRPDFGVIDLSFRSLRGAARHVIDLTVDRFAIALLKPQFEWKHPPEEFDGVVPESEIDRIVQSTLADLEGESVHCERVADSPIRGRAGNRELLVLLRDAGSNAAQEEKASRPSGAPM